MAHSTVVFTNLAITTALLFSLKGNGYCLFFSPIFDDNAGHGTIAVVGLILVRDSDFPLSHARDELNIPSFKENVITFIYLMTHTRKGNI